MMSALRNAWGISRYTVPEAELSGGSFLSYQDLFNKMVEADQQMSRK
jgi:hypothetical protein